ncbi:ParB/RepB/Spo0J family partition protein [Piscirickettsia salmonis]|uniref:ParB/RepB/Spo0J family partition protein n=1 Tax=Piscirickettsia salmonis TaxID=1238 RepID=UPI003A7F9572
MTVKTAKRRGLGKGLDALLSGASLDTTLIGKKADRNRETLKYLPIDVLQRGQYQPRRDMDPDALESLAASIRKQGVVQPIVVRPVGGEKFEIIAGERRWRASQLAGKETIPAVIRDIPDDIALALALIENIQREDLNPIEEAAALQRLIDEFDMTHQQVAEVVGRSRAAVSNLLRLMALESSVKTMLERGDLEMGHARALLSLAKNQQIQSARQVVARELSVRDTERLVKKLLEGKNTENNEKKKTVDPDIRKLQNDLADKLGASVTIKHGARGRGKLVIEYTNLDELDGILSHIQ